MLRYLEGCEIAEIAELLRLSSRAVRVRLHRAGPVTQQARNGSSAVGC